MNTPHFSPLQPSARSSEVVYRIASTRAEREAALHLVYSEYLKGGLGLPNRHQLRVTPYHLLPTTVILTAIQEHRIVMTFTLILDGDDGLPMETVYGDEVADLRSQGRRLAEVSCLASRRSDTTQFMRNFLGLIRLGVRFLRWEAFSDVVIAVHPKHARLYRRLMGFVPIGEEKTYPSVRDNPAVLLDWDLTQMRKQCPDCHKMFLSDPITEAEVAHYPVTPAESEHFRRMIDPSFTLAPLGAESAMSRVA